MPGDFSWVGLLTTDVEGAKRFYRGLFGWRAEAAAAESPAYNVMRLGGEDVALIYEMAEWQRALGAPTNWATFVSVADVDATAALATELGGTVPIAPYKAAGAGRIAVIADPQGARLSLWQPLGHLGAPRTGTVGTCCWNELATDDVDAAASYYGDLFGWEMQREPDGYRIVTKRAAGQGGIRSVPAGRRSQPHWLPYFRVGSVDATIERCSASGGTVADEAFRDPVALLRAPDGASFGVCARLPSGSGGESAAPARRAPGEAA
jgi:uncharacterized protein